MNAAELLAAAVADNIRWCSLVCASEPAVDIDGVWLAEGAPHPLFPDLVTARAGVSSAEVAARLAGRAACTVKDSFADLDLLGEGFRPLFDARWIGSDAEVSPHLPRDDRWDRVASTAGLARWSVAAGLPVPLPSHLLTASGARVIVRHENGSPAAGFVATEGGGIVGVSNVWGDSPETLWRSVVAELRTLFPGRAVVGYEQAGDLDAALGAGFAPLGALRVWSREA